MILIVRLYTPLLLVQSLEYVSVSDLITFWVVILAQRFTTNVGKRVGVVKFSNSSRTPSIEKKRWRLLELIQHLTGVVEWTKSILSSNRWYFESCYRLQTHSISGNFSDGLISVNVLTYLFVLLNTQRMKVSISMCICRLISVITL